MVLYQVIIIVMIYLMVILLIKMNIIDGHYYMKFMLNKMH